MQLELILKYFKTAFKDFKVFTGLGVHLPTTSTGGWVVGLSKTGNKANLSLSLSLDQVKLS